jgi:hypothetical protein
LRLRFAFFFSHSLFFFFFSFFLFQIPSRALHRVRVNVRLPFR